MRYFNDIKLGASGIYENYKGHIKNSSLRNYSIQLIASGKMYFQKVPGKIHIFDSPILRWQAPGNVYNYGPVDDLGWEHYFVTFKGERGRKLYEDGFCRLSDSCFIPIKRVDLFRNRFTTICNILMHGGLEKNRAAFHLEEILICAAEEISGQKSFSKYIKDFDRLCCRIRFDPQENFDLKNMAQSIDLSYSHFRKLFIEYAGVPPHQYILRSRMETAAERLRRTNDPLKQIASELNLGEPAQFSKTFRKMFEVSPATYRYSLIH